MPELEQLRAGHAPAVLAFELVNRAYFAAFVSDRGDEFFDQFPDHFGRSVEDHALVTSPKKTPHHIRAHSSKTNHSDLHRQLLSHNCQE